MENPLAPQNFADAMAVKDGMKKAEEGIEIMFNRRSSYCSGLGEEIKKNFQKLKKDIEKKLESL